MMMISVPAIIWDFLCDFMTITERSWKQWQHCTWAGILCLISWIDNNNFKKLDMKDLVFVDNLFNWYREEIYEYIVFGKHISTSIFSMYKLIFWLVLINWSSRLVFKFFNFVIMDKWGLRHSLKLNRIGFNWFLFYLYNFWWYF